MPEKHMFICVYVNCTDLPSGVLCARNRIEPLLSELWLCRNKYYDHWCLNTINIYDVNISPENQCVGPAYLNPWNMNRLPAIGISKNAVNKALNVEIIVIAQTYEEFFTLWGLTLAYPSPFPLRSSILPASVPSHFSPRLPKVLGNRGVNLIWSWVCRGFWFETRGRRDSEISTDGGA